MSFCLGVFRWAMFCIIGGASLVISAKETPNTFARTWTNNEGKKVLAHFSSLKGNKVTLILENGSKVQVELNQLSVPDQTYAKAQSFTTKQAPIEKWPSSVEVNSRALETKLLKEDPSNLNYVYRSEYFEFHSQDKLALSVVKEIARSFELTRSLITNLPWSIYPKPPEELGYYRAKFYVSRRNYILDGGPENSAGVYSTGDRTFKVPFETLGLRQRGKTWFKDVNFENGTVIHELTHQMMHDVLPFLPPWVIEGTAEYAEMLPRSPMRIHTSAHEKGIRDYMKRLESQNITFSNLLKPSELMPLTASQWSIHSNLSLQQQTIRYASACLLVYYFNHLDESKGANFRAFMKQVHEANLAWQGFFNNPKVRALSSGRYQYPANLKLPTQTRTASTGMKFYPILMGNKSLQQIDTDFKEAFSKLPIK